VLSVPMASGDLDHHLADTKANHHVSDHKKHIKQNHE